MGLVCSRVLETIGYRCSSEAVYDEREKSLSKARLLKLRDHADVKKLENCVFNFRSRTLTSRSLSRDKVKKVPYQEVARSQKAWSGTLMLSRLVFIYTLAEQAPNRMA